MGERDATYFARERGERSPTTARRRRRRTIVRGRRLRGRRDGGDGLRRCSGGRSPLILNVANRGAIPRLRDDDVVEVTCMADEHGGASARAGPMPDEALALIEPIKEYERLTVQAAVEGSYEAALKALLVHPLVGSYPLAKSILDDYLSAHAEHLGDIAR